MTGRRAARRLALRTLFHAYPRRTSALVLLALAGGVLPALFAALVGALISSAPDAVGTGFGSPGGHRLEWELIGVGVVLVLQEVSSATSSVISNDLIRRFDGYIYASIIEASTRWQDLDLFDDPAKAAQVDRAKRIAAYGPGELVSGFQTQWGQRAGGVAAAVLLFLYLPWYVVLVIAIPVVLVWLLVGRALQASYYRADPYWTEPLRRAAYLKRVGLMPDWAKELRIFGLTSWLVERYSAEWRAVMTALQQARRGDRGAMLGWTALLVVGNAAAVAAVARSGWTGAISVGATAVCVQALFGLAGLAAQDGDVWIENGAMAMPEVARFRELVAGRQPAAPTRELTQPSPQREIAFRDVAFSYPGRNSPVYEHLDLEIVAGTSVAIVGLNGAGKTTLVKLLTGLCRPDHGRVTVDGIDLSEIDIEAWRRQVAAIFQDFVRYELPARENVAFGAIESVAAPDLDRRIAAAVEDAGASDVIDRLPDGLDTVLSRRFTGGADVSGGQWQRIALARALMATRNGARVLVLDEPTAHLDVRAEVDLFDRFLELTQGLTTVLISHRFSTVRRADRIVVLEGGRIVEDGSHDELVAAGGRYAVLFGLQADRYLDQREDSDV